MHWNGPERARHQHYRNATAVQLRQDCFELAIPHQRISSHKGHMQRPVFLNQPEDTLHQSVALEVRQLTQRDSGQAQVIVFVGVAARAAQRTLACELYGNSGSSTG